MEFDLQVLWEEHLKCEFETKDALATMKTMTENPFVNHIPTMTGGYGYEEVYDFYKNHFIGKLPDDMNLFPVSRTVGNDKLVDEFVLSFTHDRQIDFMLPGVPATGKFVRLPHIVVVYFEKDKISGEHIYWDQASLLVQIGLLDSANFPISGIEQSKKFYKKDCPSNTLIKKFLL